MITFKIIKNFLFSQQFLFHKVIFINFYILPNIHYDFK